MITLSKSFAIGLVVYLDQAGHSLARAYHPTDKLGSQRALRAFYEKGDPPHPKRVVKACIQADAPPFDAMRKACQLDPIVREVRSIPNQIVGWCLLGRIRITADLWDLILESLFNFKEHLDDDLIWRAEFKGATTRGLLRAA